MKSNILILGGSGFIGSVLCEKLVRRSQGGDALVTVATRRLSHARHLQHLPTVEVVEADINDDADLARLVVGCDAVVNLIGILHGREVDFERVHAALPRRLAEACAHAGTRRVVHVSALGADALAPSKYLRSKAAGEAALQQSGLAATCLRPSVVFGAGDRFMNLFAGLQMFAPLVPLAGAAARFQPVWVEDVADAIVAALDDPATVGKTFECAGPRVYALAELVRLAGRWSGHPRWVWPLPVALAWPMAVCMEWLPGEPVLSRDNLLSMEVPNVASGHCPGLEALGIVPTPLEAVGPAMLGTGGELARLDRWRAEAHAAHR
jgi:NADH dehydrogenase